MTVVVVICFALLVVRCSFAQDIKEPAFAGSFYPADPQELSTMLDGFLAAADPAPVNGDIFALISPHAGLGYSGQTAAYGYKLVQGRPYKTVIILAPSHQFGFIGASVYPAGHLRTPLGDVEIDDMFTRQLLNKDKEVIFEPRAFEKEHSIEVQLPFLQKVLPAGWKAVPIVLGDCPLATCQKLADLLKAAVGSRKDVLVIASSDMYHGYDYDEAAIVDTATLSCLKNMDAERLYYGLREEKFQLCGGFAVVTTMLLSKELGHNKLDVLKYTNSAEVIGKKQKGIWTVGYGSCVIDTSNTLAVNGERSRTIDTPATMDVGREKGEGAMLNKEQRKKLLEIARKSIETYLKTGKKLEVKENDLVLTKEMGAFVTLNEHNELRGCIGNLVGREPLYLTVRDMAVEAATGDPRFAPVKLNELKDIEIEISVLSPMERVDSADKIEMGKHGVLIRRGGSSGVFLPQVATETGWSREEFLSNLCSHKAGLPADAWKDKSAEIYIFTAEVFSEKE